MDNIKETKFSEENTLIDPPQISTSIFPMKRKREDLLLPSKKVQKYSGMKGYEVRSLFVSNPIKFCQDHKLLASSVTCSCGEPMEFSPRTELTDGFHWCCRRRKLHNSRLSIRKGSWFENSRLSIPDILWIAYMWLYEYSYVSMLHECNQTMQTLIEWCTSCRDACQVILEQKTKPIGGSDKLVEIFEARFRDSGKSKSARTHSKNDKDQWVFCALEQFSTNSILVTVQNKRSETLCELLDKYILPGTTVFSHVWNAYTDLSSEHFEYLTDVKSITFHDAHTKADIDTVDKFWGVAERPRPGLNYWAKFEYNSKFCEYIYRKSLAFAPDAYFAFLDDIAMIFKPQDIII